MQQMSLKDRGRSSNFFLGWMSNWCWVGCKDAESDLADTVLELRVPVMLVIPKIRNYSLINETKSLKEKLLKEEERKAFFIGLGDIIFPGILFVSTFYNIPSNGLLIALSVVVGTLLGFIALAASLGKGKPQAGLPYLNSGAILGYLISSYLLFGKLVGI